MLTESTKTQHEVRDSGITDSEYLYETILLTICEVISLIVCHETTGKYKASAGGDRQGIKARDTGRPPRVNQHPRNCRLLVGSREQSMQTV